MQQLSTLLSSVLADAATGVGDAEQQAAAERLDLAEQLRKPPAELVSDVEIDRQLRDVAPTLVEPPEDLLRERLPAEQVERYLDSWQPGYTAVRRGEVYLHSAYVDEDRATRFDDLEEAFDVRLDEDALAFRGGLPFLTDEATQRVRESVATDLGERRKQVLTRAAESGLPRPVVEHLDVDVKLTFDSRLRARAVDAVGADEVVPEAVGSVEARMHFESEEV